MANSIGNREIHEIGMQKFNEYTKQYEKDQQSNKSFDKVYKKKLQDILIDENFFQKLH